MFTFQKIPFFWILLAFIAGILIPDTLSGPHLLLFATTVLIVSLGCIVFVFYRALSATFLLMVMIFISFGVIRYLQVHDGNSHYLMQQNALLDQIEFECRITETLSDGKFSKRIAVITSIQREYLDLTGSKILVYFKRDSTSTERVYKNGQKYRITASISGIPSAKNPAVFDYRRYMHAKNVHWQVFPDTSNLSYLGAEKNFSAFVTFSGFRIMLVEKLHEFLPDKRSAALVAALTLGDKSTLDSSVLESFSNTGARHILTVSGMHVGIIMLIAMFFTGFIRKTGILSILLRNILLLGALWGYVFLIGAQPAVMRAGFMLSTYLAGLSIFRSYSGLNSLAFSAFILLFFNPLMIFQLSFLFSYLALFSILVFYQPIVKLWKPRNKAVVYIWQLLSLSMAAQIIMMPVSAYFFHKAPLFFAISGIIATPAAFGIFSLTILFFLEIFILRGVTNVFGTLLHWLSDIFIESIGFLDKLPFGTVDNLWLNPITLLLISGIIGMFAIALLGNKKNYIFYGLTLLIIYNGVRFHQKMNQLRHQEICIYADNKSIVIDLFINRICYSIQSDTLSDAQAAFIYKNHRMKYGIQKVHHIPLSHDYKDQYISYQEGVLKFSNLILFIQPERYNGSKVSYNGESATSKKVDLKEKNHPELIEIDVNNTNDLYRFYFLSDPEDLTIKTKALKSGIDLVVIPMHLPFWKVETFQKKHRYFHHWNIREKGALRIVWN